MPYFRVAWRLLLMTTVFVGRTAAGEPSAGGITEAVNRSDIICVVRLSDGGNQIQPLLESVIANRCRQDIGDALSNNAKKMAAIGSGAKLIALVSTQATEHGSVTCLEYSDGMVRYVSEIALRRSQGVVLTDCFYLAGLLGGDANVRADCCQEMRATPTSKLINAITGCCSLAQIQRALEQNDLTTEQQRIMLIAIAVARGDPSKRREVLWSHVEECLRGEWAGQELLLDAVLGALLVCDTDRAFRHGCELLQKDDVTPEARRQIVRAFAFGASRGAIRFERVIELVSADRVKFHCVYHRVLDYSVELGVTVAPEDVVDMIEAVVENGDPLDRLILYSSVARFLNRKDPDWRNRFLKALGKIPAEAQMSIIRKADVIMRFNNNASTGCEFFLHSE